MPLLLLPLLVLALVALWLVLLPFALWARYRAGRARRRAVGWIVRSNAWFLALSLPLFGLSAWWASHWVADALRDAGLGLLLGVLLGILALWLTRFDADARGLTYTPSRWPALLLTTLVALRIVAGLWVAWRHVVGGGPTAWSGWLETGGWLGVAGLFLGYGLAYAWGLRARLARWQRAVRR
jgi:hypothetical protein